VKITKNTLKQLIKEELGAALDEAPAHPLDDPGVAQGPTESYSEAMARELAIWQEDWAHFKDDYLDVQQAVRDGLRGKLERRGDGRRRDAFEMFLSTKSLTEALDDLFAIINKLDERFKGYPE